MQQTERALGIACALIGAAGMLAWVLDASDATALHLGWATLKFNTALCLAAVGAALAVRPGPGALGLRLLATCVTTLTLAEWLLGVDLNIDELLFPDGRSVALGLPAGRMAPATAVALLSLAAGGLLLRRPDPRAAQGLAVFAAAIAWVAVLGYATDLGPLATVSAFGTVSLPTAAALALAAAGTLLARSGEGLLVALGRKDSASLLVRRLGPVVLLVPAVAGWASSHASRAWQPGFGPAVAATVNALAFGAVLLHTAAAVRTEALAREEVAAARDALARRLVDATERERAHLARELHDHFGQALITLTLLAERLPHAEGRPIREGLGALGDDLRRVALTLRPPLLDVLGPVEAIRVHAEGWSTATSIPVAIECAADELKVPDHIAVTAYRIVQEALNNVARHAGASSVRLRIDLSKAQLHVRVADDGKGFETTAVEADRTGLAGIVERARLQMGTATILSGPQGTIVDVHLPVPS